MTVEVVRKDLCTPVVFISRPLELLFSFFFFSSTIFRKIEKLRLIVGGNGVSILDGVLVIDTR